MAPLCKAREARGQFQKEMAGDFMWSRISDSKLNCGVISYGQEQRSLFFVWMEKEGTRHGKSRCGCICHLLCVISLVMAPLVGGRWACPRIWPQCPLTADSLHATQEPIVTPLPLQKKASSNTHRCAPIAHLSSMNTRGHCKHGFFVSSFPNKDNRPVVGPFRLFSIYLSICVYIAKASLCRKCWPFKGQPNFVTETFPLPSIEWEQRGSWNCTNTSQVVVFVSGGGKRGSNGP